MSNNQKPHACISVYSNGNCAKIDKRALAEKYISEITAAVNKLAESDLSIDKLANTLAATTLLLNVASENNSNWQILYNMGSFFRGKTADTDESSKDKITFS